MSVAVVRIGLCAAALLLTPGQIWSSGAHAGEVCTTANLSSFSRLGAAVEQARAKTPGKLLATWLLRSTEPGTCEFIFRIDLLLDDGRVLSMNFDAKSLDAVEIDVDRGWVDADGSGAGGEPTGAGDSGSSQDSDDQDHDDDTESDPDDDDSEDDSDDSHDNSGPGGGDDSSGPGGGDDSSGPGGGDDSGGSGGGDD